MDDSRQNATAGVHIAQPVFVVQRPKYVGASPFKFDESPIKPFQLNYPDSFAAARNPHPEP